MRTYVKIVATGSFIPPSVVENTAFLDHKFFDSEGKLFSDTNDVIISKFQTITGIEKRRYVSDDSVTSDIAFFAASNAFSSSSIDPESLDYIIFAHNFGDVRSYNKRSDIVPSLAARVKHLLKIRNPKTIVQDVGGGCPGWLMGVIQANAFIRSGDAKRIMVIGAETLSRVSDPHDRDSMIYSDGAAATIFDAVESEEPVGILAHTSRSDTLDHAYLLRMGKSNDPYYPAGDLFLKMRGGDVYEYALTYVPLVVKESLDKAGVSLGQVKKLLIHQANDKMDQKILQLVGKLYGNPKISNEIMPMTINWLGNSSVATLPTLLDLLLKGQLPDHSVTSGDILIFASIGAGMNINAMVYKML